jgi:hypothetical protein
VFCSGSALWEAAVMGVAPRVTVTHLGDEDLKLRSAASVHGSLAQLAEQSGAEGRAFSFDIRGLPKVTARHWRSSKRTQG